jgi:hypothetical protein
LKPARLRNALRYCASIVCTVAFFALALSPSASAQVPGAIIDGTAGSAVYVNPGNSAASDSGTGSAGQPFKTISQAIVVAMARRSSGAGTRIEVYPGVYRESLVIGPSHEINAPIVLEPANKTGPVIISGANEWQGWQQTKPGFWSHQWPYQWGVAPAPKGWESQHLSPMVRRREMVIFDGRSLAQVEAPGAMQDKVDSFYVDEPGATIYLHASASGQSPKIEIGERRSLLLIEGQSQIIIRGLGFQYSNGPLQEAAVNIENSSNVQLERCAFDWNNWMGLSVRNVNGLTIEGSEANYNGGAGMTIWRTNDLLVHKVVTSHNNWRGYAGGFIGWAVAGIKSLQNTNSRYSQLVASDNQSKGLWFDTGCSNVVIEDASLCGNYGDGIFIEANPGPFEIRHSIICSNQNGAGVLSGNSSNVVLEKDIIYGNSKAQIMISGVYTGTRPMKDWKTGMTVLLRSDHWQIAHSVIESQSRGQPLIATTLAPATWKNFIDTLTANDNVWYNPDSPAALQMAGGLRVDLGHWQQLSSQDRNSKFVDPGFRDPANQDFGLSPQSPLIGLGLPSGIVSGSN